MTAPSTPLTAENLSDQLVVGAPRVRVLVSVVEGADLAAALAVVGRQVYEPLPELVIVGAEGETPEGYLTAPNLERAIADTDEKTDFLWLLHSDARPRPDALAALVSELGRNEASLGGSKLLVAGTRDELESVGSATDVFGEPHSGLEAGEIDLQQYDVVREVAFVGSASMLVRRDLAQGLGGLDVLLPPIAAGLDFSQRSRLAGGKVISVPSSEVYHQGRCNEGLGGWREQAGRLRAMLKAYKPLTLLWVVPYDFLVSVVDSLANLVLLRWRPAARHLVSWLWNLSHLPSTIGSRRRLRSVRVSGDEELFRFQARGSVRLRDIGSEISARLLSVFDDDEALSRRSRRVWASPGIWGALAAVAVAVFSARSLIFTGIPDVGFSFPFEPAGTAFSRWIGGWNESGLGSSSPVHPSSLLAGVVSALFLGAEGAARTVLTISLAIIGIAGMGRLGGRYGLRGPGRYLAGLVLIAGPGTAVLTAEGSWPALAAAAFLPWAIRAVLPHPDRGENVGDMGWAFLMNVPLVAVSPILGLVPFLFALGSTSTGPMRRRMSLGMSSLAAGIVMAPFLIGDPGWLTDATRRLGAFAGDVWAPFVAASGLALVFAKERMIGAIGALISLTAIVMARLGPGGPGVEEGLLVLASLGAAMLAAAGVDTFRRELRPLISVILALGLIVLSVGSLGNGRYGLPSGAVNEQLGFSPALAGPSGPGRILMASTERSDIPGEARPGPGFWYRLVDGNLMTIDEMWLPQPLPGDGRLDEALTRIAGGDVLRPGQQLADYAIEWVVLLGPVFRLDEVLVAQIDMVPTPLDPGSRVFENTVSVPLADAGDEVWVRQGTGFSGPSTGGPVRLAVNYDVGWQPGPVQADWATQVDGEEGSAGYRGPLTIEVAALILCVAAMVLIVVGRARR